MAVIDEVPGMEVTVVVDGKPLHEYTDEEDGDKKPESPTKTVYIESREDQAFHIDFEVRYGNFAYKGDQLAWELYLDGVEAQNGFLQYVDHREERESRSIRDIYVKKANGWTGKNMLFSKLSTTEETKEHKARCSLSELGRISMRWFRVQIGATCENERSDQLSLGVDKIPEKLLKGRPVLHQIKLSGAEKAVKRSFRSFRYIDPKPVMTYNFNYTSRAGLQSLLIIPRDPSPSQTTSDSEQSWPGSDKPVDKMSREELEEMALRYRAHSQTFVRGIKREREHFDDSDELRIVKTQRVRGFKGPFNPESLAQVVELSSDDEE